MAFQWEPFQHFTDTVETGQAEKLNLKNENSHLLRLGIIFGAVHWVFSVGFKWFKHESFHAPAKFETFDANSKRYLNCPDNYLVSVYFSSFIHILFWSWRILLQFWCFTLDKELVIQVSSKLKPLCCNLTSLPLHNSLSIR